jgi:hypothetical protein
MGTKRYGTIGFCHIFLAELYDEDRGVTGHLQRLPECLALDEPTK